MSKETQRLPIQMQTVEVQLFSLLGLLWLDLCFYEINRDNLVDTLDNIVGYVNKNSSYTESLMFQEQSQVFCCCQKVTDMP
jgi:hypothetical protein